jgi:hypothetical protein
VFPPKRPGWIRTPLFLYIFIIPSGRVLPHGGFYPIGLGL